jgi:glycosyltransferase involved in cell wall biosynthesis
LIPNEPLVSIVIPVLNGAQFIQETLASVIDQSYEHLELIVADDASTDTTRELVEAIGDSRIRLLSPPEQRLGLHANWERGVAAARGELVKIVCHDDVLLPGCLAAQVRLMEAHPTAALVASRRRIVDHAGRMIIRARGLRSLARKAGGGPIERTAVLKACARAGTNLLGEPASVLFRRSALPTPLLDRRWTYVVDIDLYLRCLQNGNALIDPGVRASFRLTSGQLSAQLVGLHGSELRVFFKEVTSSQGTALGTADLWLRTMRILAQSWGRRGIYVWIRLRENHRGFANRA